MEIIAIAVYLLFVIASTFTGRYIWNNKSVDSSLARFVIGVFIYPFLGLLFKAFGFILNHLGEFMISPLFPNIF